MSIAVKLPVSIVGVPIHPLTMDDAVLVLRDHIDSGERCFMSTPNLNFLIASLHDDGFRHAVVRSELSVADGMPLLWLAKLLGIQLPERVAGSDLFDALRAGPADKPARVFFFGGEGDAAEAAMAELNATPQGLLAVGALNPGMGTPQSLSKPEYLDIINQSEADFLVVSLGAVKGQAWIVQNLSTLKTPLISHLGAVVNFAAGTVERAPGLMQRLGLEWFWRIYQEPQLWRRYFDDGMALLRLVLGRVLPYRRWLRRHRPQQSALEIDVQGMGSPDLANAPPTLSISLKGALDHSTRDQLWRSLEPHLLGGSEFVLDLDALDYLDPAGLGVLLMLEGHALRQQQRLLISRCNPAIKRILEWNNMGHLTADV